MPPLVGGLAPKLGAKHLKIISVRSFVTETEPGLLDALNRLPISYRWVTRFLPLDREEGRKQLEIIRKRWFSKRKGLLTLLREALFREEAALLDNDASNQTDDADLALAGIGRRRRQRRLRNAHHHYRRRGRRDSRRMRAPNPTSRRRPGLCHSG